jgi:DNA helicase-2/ATP-dependent DNA helicase PcrA
MRPAKYRYTKELWSGRKSKQKPILVQCMDEAEQSRLVCDTILQCLEEGIPLRQQAVLFRAAWHSGELEVELARRKIPFHKYGGLRFLEAAHVKDLLALLRILENPSDEMSWFRVLELLDGIGPKSARHILQHLQAHRYDFDCLASAKVPAVAEDKYQKLAEMLVSLQRPQRKLPVASQIERLRRFYDPLLPRLYENPTPRRRDLEQIELMAQRYRSRASFITDLTLDPPNSTADLAGPPRKDEDFLILSTMHSAKGLEWRVVYIIHAADGMIPSDMALDDEEGLEEERRLFYVAITRAKDWLYTYFPLRYYYRRFGLSDAHGYAQLTRFLPRDVLPLVEPRTGEAMDKDEEAEVGLSPGRRTEAEIRKRISRMWDRPKKEI